MGPGKKPEKSVKKKRAGEPLAPVNKTGEEDKR